MTHRIWMVGSESLTPEQRRIVTLPVRDNQLILGPAGSGKTVLLLHRADYLLRDLHIAPHRLRVLVFTNVLKNYIRSGSQAINLPESIVQSFYSWVFELARERRVRFSREGSLANQCRNVLSAVLEYFQKNHVSPALDVALVDEGQDLPLEAHRLLAMATCHVTVCADYEQRLYEHGTDLPEALAILGIRDGPAALAHNLRSSAAIKQLAASFLTQTERQRYLASEDKNSLPTTLRIPLLFRSSSVREQWQRLAAIVRHEIGRNARVGVLLPSNDLVDEAYFHLSKQRVPVQRITTADHGRPDFDELVPKVLTIFSAKGLSFDSVLVPCVTGAHYCRRPTAGDKLLFVACTRALDWVCLGTVVGQEPTILSKAHELTVAGHLIEQEAGAAAGSAIAAEPLVDEEVPL